MRSPLLFVAALVGALAFAPAASSARIDSDADRLCATLHTLPAARKQACCGAGGSDLAAICTIALKSSLERDAVRLDLDRVAQCESALGKSLAGCDWVSPLQPALPAACSNLISGEGEAGTQCHSSLECNDGLYCRGLSPLAPGVCALPAQPGARCELPADHLAAYTRATDDPRHPSCNGLCIRGQCLAAVAEGGQCHASAICANGLGCFDGHCRSITLPKLGESCDTQSGCGDQTLCIAGTCTAPKAGGESCKQPFECRSFQCNITPGSTTGQCTNACAALQSPQQLHLIATPH